RIEIGHVDQIISAELLLGLGVGPVEHLRLAVGDPHGARRASPLQPVAVDTDLRLVERFGIGAIGADPLVDLRVARGLHAGFVAVDQQHVLHLESPRHDGAVTCSTPPPFDTGPAKFSRAAFAGYAVASAHQYRYSSTCSSGKALSTCGGLAGAAGRT